MRTKALVLTLSAGWLSAPLLGQASITATDRERSYAASKVAAGASIVQSRQDGLTVLATYEDFIIEMPDGTIQDRGAVARILDDDGRKVAELLVIEEADLVVWQISGAKEAAGPLERIGFPLTGVDAANRYSAAAPSRALRWSHDFLLDLWKSERRSLEVKDEPAGLRTKDTVGCDSLHWLDNSTLRPCCDDHDQCYRTNVCTAASWNPFAESWQCTGCNANVVACFALSYWLRGGVIWRWCWGLGCCEPPDYFPCILIECT